MSAAAVAPYKRSLYVLWVLTVPLLVGVFWMAALHPTGRVELLPVAVLLTVLSIAMLVRLPSARLEVTHDGRLRHRVLVTRQVRLDELVSVAVVPSLPYQDSGMYGLVPNAAFVLTDRSGTHLVVHRSSGHNGQFSKTAPVLAGIISALHASDVVVSPACWGALHADAGFDVPPYPVAWGDADPATWGRPTFPRRASRANQRLYWRFLLAAPFGTGLISAMTIGDESWAAAGAALAGGLVVSGLGWGYLAWVAAADRREYVTIDAAGHLSGTRRTSRWRLGTAEQRIDLTSLTRVQVEPWGKATNSDLPGTWRLMLQRGTDAAVVFDLLHESEPDGVFYPQLVHHLETGGLPLSEETHRALSLRLGRPLAVPIAAGS